MRFFMGFAMAVCLAFPAAAAQRLFMLDFVFLNENVTLAARDAYNAKAAPIAARHGVELQATLDPVRVVIGPQSLDRLDLWTLPEPAALKQWGDDPDYQAMRVETLAVHDMTHLTLYLAREMGPVRIAPSGLYWVEFLRFDEAGFNGDDFSAYMAEIDAIAGKHAMRRVATFGKVGRILGQGFQAHWMNIYSVADPAQLEENLRDPRFVERAAMRNRLFDMDKSMMGVFQAR